MSSTSITPTPTKSKIGQAAIGWMIALVLEAGTGGAYTIQYWNERMNRGHQPARFDFLGSTAADAAICTPCGNIKHIRLTMKLTITELANLIGVSRQAVYDWLDEKPMSSENAQKVSDLISAFNILSMEGLSGSPRLLHRSISDGKSFFELVRSGDSPVGAARKLAGLIQREMAQRRQIEKRLSNRARPSRGAFEEIGAPILDEEL